MTGWWPPGHGPRWQVRGGTSQCSVSLGSFQPWDGLSVQLSIWGFVPDVQSSRSLDLMAIDTVIVAINWNYRSSHSNQAQYLLQEIKKYLVWVSHILVMMFGTPFIHHQWGSLSNMWTPPTWEKGSHLPPQTTRLGNLRDGCNPSQLPLLNQIFRILLLCVKPNQGCQKCDQTHRDARWIGGYSHQSSNLSQLHNLLQKVLIPALPNTGFERMQEVSYPTNYQTTKGIPKKFGHMQIDKQGTQFI